VYLMSEASAAVHTFDPVLVCISAMRRGFGLSLSSLSK
jgi:hypothetical protein